MKALSLGLFAAALAAGEAAAQAPPNVLLVVADDLAAGALGAYGNPEVLTPNVDRLAARGTVFDSAYCQYPVCAHSRASMLSGLYVQQLTGSNGGFTNLDSVLGSRSTLPEHFRQAGYTAARVSKLYHMRVPGDITNGAAGSDHAPSWDVAVNVQAPEWQTPGTAGHYTNETLNFDPNLHYGLGFGTAFYAVEASTSGAEQADHVAVDEAISLLEGFGGQPFFLAVGFVRPHVPLVAPAADFAPYDPSQLSLAQSVPGDLADIPAAGIFWNEPARGPNSDPDRREVLRAYYASVSFMDRQLGRLLDRLEQLGLEDDTLVVFTSDHGYHLGEHTFWQKLSLHEESARVPLIAAGPGIQTGRRGQVAELVDLYPTLADLAGLPIPTHCAGQSLRGVIEGSSGELRTGAYSRIAGGELLRTPTFAYMRYSNGAEELYDMGPAPLGDPLQFTNLVGDPAFASTLSVLRDQLDARVAEIDEGSGELYCAGDGSSGLCPCLFFGGAGEGCLHSAGSGARLSGSGYANVAADTLRLDVLGGPPGRPGLLVSGLTPAAAPLGDGLLCLQTQVRYAPVQLDAQGAASYAQLGLPSLAGSTVHYQFAFRDAGPCGGGFNLSSAWRVTWH